MNIRLPIVVLSLLTTTLIQSVKCDDIIATSPGAGSSPTVNVYDASTAGLETTFSAFSPSFTGGVSVAVDDLNGTGAPEIVVGAGSGGSPQVAIFDSTAMQLNIFDAFNPSYTGGINVAVGNVSGGSVPDI